MAAIPPTRLHCSIMDAWCISPNLDHNLQYEYETLWHIQQFRSGKLRRRTEHWLQIYNRMVDTETHGLGVPPSVMQSYNMKRNYREGRYKTQKVMGILSLAGGNTEYTKYALVLSPRVSMVIQDEKGLADLPNMIGNEKFPLFARPCPITPQHGFVESRPVADASSVIDVMLEAKAVDPEAEVLLMPILSSRYSGIITIAGVAIGKGNEGATSGMGTSCFIPAPTPATVRRQKISPKAGIATSPYIEFVENNFRPCLVQLRDGPEPQGAYDDWVPKDVVVTQVITPISYIGQCLPLQEWQKRLEALPADKTGIVANLFGMTLASHYAVQAITHGIPVITSKQIVKGVKLKSSLETKPIPLRAPDYRQIATNLCSRLIYPMPPKDIETWADMATTTVMGVAHTQALWPGKQPQLNALRGQAVALAIRLGMTICLGEGRHYRDHCDNIKDSLPFLPIFLQEIGEGPKWTKGSEGSITRHGVYKWALNCDLAHATLWTGHTLKLFSEPEWKPNFGGKKWALIAASILDLLLKAQEFACQPTKLTWHSVAKTMDIVVDSMHNSGFAFSKFVSSSSIDLVALEPVWGLISPLAAEIALDRTVARGWVKPTPKPRNVLAFTNMKLKEIPNVETIQEILDLEAEKGEEAAQSG